MKNKIKLSDKQKEVIKLMREGYEAGSTSRYWSNTWLQYGGIGCGGKTASLSKATIRALEKIGIVTANVIHSRETHYPLTELGEKIDIT